jgi:hypothetical protein
VVQNLVTEWAPPTFDSLIGQLFLLALLLTAVILAISPRRPTLLQILGFLCMAVLGLKTSRGIVWFGLVMAPVVAEHFALIFASLIQSGRTAKRSDGSPVLNWIFVAGILCLVLITLPWFKEHLPFPSAKAGLISGETPILATDYILETQPPGNLFHAMSFGSYLIWAAQPEYPVFVDGRIELYSIEVWRDYLDISNAQGDWELLLERSGVNTLMLSRTEQPRLVEAVEASDQWMLVHEDDAALVFLSR